MVNPPKIRAEIEMGGLKSIQEEPQLGAQESGRDNEANLSIDEDKKSDKKMISGMEEKRAVSKDKFKRKSKT